MAGFPFWVVLLRCIPVFAIPNSHLSIGSGVCLPHHALGCLLGGWRWWRCSIELHFFHLSGLLVVANHAAHAGGAVHVLGGRGDAYLPRRVGLGVAKHIRVALLQLGTLWVGLGRIELLQ